MLLVDRGGRLGATVVPRHAYLGLVCASGEITRLSGLCLIYLALDSADLSQRYSSVQVTERLGEHVFEAWTWMWLLLRSPRTR